jgi:preprotein translocase subunit SecG
MNTTLTIIVVIQVVAALTIIGLVLLQHGKGADMGAAFGSGASGSLFGATGSSNFLSKSTGVAAAVFFAATLGLAFFGNRHVASTGGVMDRLPAPAAQTPASGAGGTGGTGGTSTGAAVPAAPATAVPQSTAPAAPAAGANPAPTAPANGAGQSSQIPK